MVPVINIDELANKKEMSETPVVFRAEVDHVCQCGHAVCCGKHKSGQCSCHKDQKERS